METRQAFYAASIDLYDRLFGRFFEVYMELLVEFKASVSNAKSDLVAILKSGGIQDFQIAEVFDRPGSIPSRFLTVELDPGLMDKAMRLLQAAPQVVSVMPQPEATP